MLAQYGEGTNEWYETIRYFFMPKDDKIYEYQFKKLLDEIRLLTVLKANVEMGDAGIHIYQVDTQRKVYGLEDIVAHLRGKERTGISNRGADISTQDWLHAGTYIYSDSKAAM